MTNGEVLLYYKYWEVSNPEVLCEWQDELARNLGLKGRIHCSAEGINGTIGGDSKSCNDYIIASKEHDVFGAMFREVDFKRSPSKCGGANEFPMLFVKLVKEIISIGEDPDVISYKDTGEHLTPKEFHERISEPDFFSSGDDANHKNVLLDCRNMYESAVGRFVGSIRVPTRRFDEFPSYCDDILSKELQDENMPKKDVNIYMYCTGGIRCERGSAYLKHIGFKNVYQLTGGIHRYCENIPPEESLFHGKNFVFDRRITTDRVYEGTIVGKCRVCSKAYDTYRKGNKCQRCKALIILCDACSKKKQNLVDQCICEICSSTL